MKFKEFGIEDKKAAAKLALSNYEEERKQVTSLPAIKEVPCLEYYADNGLGIAAYEGKELIGFLACNDPWNRAFDSTAVGTFSPIHAHGAIKENRGRIYERLYQEAARVWVKHKITYHGIAFYAHDTEAINTMFHYGFGHRCVDAIRSMTDIFDLSSDSFQYEELDVKDAIKLREIRRRLSQHMGESPCFMHSTEEEFMKHVIDREKNGRRLFITREQEKIIAFLELSDVGENFITRINCLKNITGAFCLPEYRGRLIYQNLIQYVVQVLRQEGYQYLGVDYESFNPTASHFWSKLFTPYTASLVRRIDECALRD